MRFAPIGLMSLPAALPRIVGAKLPLRPMHVWTIRVRLEIDRRVRDLALFDIALDSKLRGCDIVALRLADIMAAGSLRRRATIIQQKTGRPVQFEITDQTRRSLADWLRYRRPSTDDWLFPSRMYRSPSIDSAIHPAGEAMGGADPARAGRIRHPQRAQNESVSALPEDRQPQSVPAAPGPHQAGEHCALCRCGAR